MPQTLFLEPLQSSMPSGSTGPNAAVRVGMRAVANTIAKVRFRGPWGWVDGLVGACVRRARGGPGLWHLRVWVSCGAVCMHAMLRRH